MNIAITLIAIDGIIVPVNVIVRIRAVFVITTGIATIIVVIVVTMHIGVRDIGVMHHRRAPVQN